MNLDAYQSVLKRFGLAALLYDLIMSVLNKVLGLRIQIVYVIEQVVEHPPQPDTLDIHPLTDSELDTWTGQAGYELPANFVAQARANGDVCFGAFIDGVLCAYAWYAENPCTFSNGLTARCGPQYVYAYKSLTLPGYRSQNLQRWLKFHIFDVYRARGKAGILVAIDSQNFASRRSTVSVGARSSGFWVYTLNDDHYRGWGSAKARATGFSLSAPPAAPAPLLIHRGTSPAALRVQRIDSLDALKAVAPQYQRLPENLGDYCALFYQIGWIEQMAALYLTPRKRLFFLLAWDGDELVGVAPLQIEHKDWLRGGVRRLYFLGGIQGSLNNMACDFLIPDRARAQQCLAAFRAYLLGQARSAWDIIDLAYLPDTSPNFSAFEATFPELRKRRESMQNFMLALPASFDAYSATLDTKVLREIRRRQRRFQETEPTLTFELAHSLTDTLRSGMADIHTHRQQELRDQGATRHHLFDNPAQRQTLFNCLDYCASQGQLRLYYIALDGKPIAFFLGLAFKDVIHLYLTGFNSDFNKYGPSKLLMLYIVENEIARGTTLVNMSTGVTRFKQEFCDRVIDNWHYFGINGRAGARLRYTLWQTVIRLKR